MSKITYEDIKNEVYKLPVFGELGSDDPMLSKPMLKVKEDGLYCVFMVYRYYYESIPSYYIITPLPKLSPQVMEAKDAMKFLDMPDEVVFGEDDTRVFSSDGGNLYDMFDECLAEENLSAETYNKYLDAVKASAAPTAVRFYEFFRMG